jgi:cell division protein ZipA
MDQYWLTILIVLLIVGIIVDGVRRMRRARRDSLKMALRPVSRQAEDDGSEPAYGSEFPNGGARPSGRQIDPNRIKQVRSKYNFGDDIASWREKVSDKIAEHTHKVKAADSETQLAPKMRIEPSFSEGADPLMDKPVMSMEDSPEWMESNDIVTEFDDLPLETPHPEPLSPDAMPSETMPSETISSEHIPYETRDALIEEPDDMPSVAETLSKGTPKREPVQTSLNLDDAVPMLMDSLDNGDVIEKTRHQQKVKQVEPIVSVAKRMTAKDDKDDSSIGTHSANKPRYESKYADHAKQSAAPQDVLIINVKAPANEFFYGSDLLELILDNGLRFGAMDIFHHHADEDGEGPILFSMASMVKPGTFDLHTFEEFSTVGLSFFLTLPTETGKNMDAFETMLATAKDIAKRLGGELNDENRSVLTGQTIEHYRERIRDFSRRQQLEKNK